jgi:hypothetical protein
VKHIPHTLPRSIILLFFITGLLSALSFRALIIIKELEPEWFRPVWYFGITGYIIFFSYRYIISVRRRRIIEDYDLVNKVRQGCLSDEERQAVEYLLMSIRKSKENLNYLFIFITSAIAILVDLLL